MLLATQRGRLAPARHAGYTWHRRAVVVQARANVTYAPEDVSISRAIGSGSFGEVWEGTLKRYDGSSDKVVLKRIKPTVQNADEVGEMEMKMNEYASNVAPEACADFLGHVFVGPQESTRRLRQGLWLIWRLEGTRSLSFFLKRRQPLQTLAAELGVPLDSVVPTVMKQLLQNIAALHAAGLVHRDIKPSNLILARDRLRFVLVDLGAAVDLRGGANYKPDESIMDPAYCPPEKYVLPTDTPKLSRNRVAQFMSPLLWAVNKPDRFDTWCAGMVMLQLCFSSLRSDAAMRSFKRNYAECDYDLQRWRTTLRLPAAEQELLDADGGAGWALLQALLRPRRIKEDDDGNVSFVYDGRAPRLSANEALRQRFIQRAAEPTATLAHAGGMSSDEDYESDGAAEGTGTSGTSLLGFLGTMGTKLNQAMGGSSRSRRQAAGEDDGTSSTSSTSRTSRTSSTRSGTSGTGRQQQGGSSRTSRTSSTRRNMYAADGAESNNGTAGTRGTGKSVLKSGWLRDAVNDQAAQLQALLSNQTEAVSEQKMVLSRLRQQVAMGLASAGEYAAEEARLEKLQLRLAQLQEALELAQEQVGTAVEAVRKAGTAGVKVLGSMKVAVGDASKAVSRAAETMSAISSFASSAGSMATSVINAGTSSRRVRDDTQEGSQVWGTVKQAAKQAASSALQQAALGLVNTSRTLGETAVEVVGTAVQRRKQIQEQASAIEWQQELLQRMMQQDADPEDYRAEQRKLSMMRLRMQELQQGAAGMLVNLQGAVSGAADSLASSQPGSPRAAAAAAASAAAAAASGMTASLTAVRQLLQQAQVTQKQQDLLLQLKRQPGMAPGGQQQVQQEEQVLAGMMQQMQALQSSAAGVLKSLTSAAGTLPLASAEGGAVAAGLKLTGQAASAVSSLKQDIESTASRWSEMGQEASEQASAERSFLEMLGESSQPITRSTDYDDVEWRFRNDGRYHSVPSDERRRQLFSSFQAAAKEAPQDPITSSTNTWSEAVASASSRIDAATANARPAGAAGVVEMDVAELQLLRAEQGRMLSEYRVMAAKLLQMEAALQLASKELSSQRERYGEGTVEDGLDRAEAVAEREYQSAGMR